MFNYSCTKIVLLVTLYERRYSNLNQNCGNSNIKFILYFYDYYHLKLSKTNKQLLKTQLFSCLLYSGIHFGLSLIQGM